LSNEELASQADLIAVGKCVETHSQWFGRTLATLATVSVSEVVKGDPTSSVVVALPGGVDANRRFPVAMTYPGGPTMVEQEDVFLFLVAEDQVPGAYAILGYAQGKFSIVQAENGELLVSRELIRRPRNLTKAVPLGRFKSEIHDYVRRQR
jgi:hypothetical protein